MKKSGKSKAIYQYILDNVEEYPSEIVRKTAEHFEIARQTAGNHIKDLVQAGTLVATGNTRARTYRLSKETWIYPFRVAGLEEHIVWRDSILPLLNDLPENVLSICSYGINEMVNNVIDHSASENVVVRVERDAISVLLSVIDSGVGIFNKILTDHPELTDPRQALLELAKGKLTSDERHHTGQGVFFSSRMFDEFMIYSEPLFFHRINKEDSDWLLDASAYKAGSGTTINMRIRKDSVQTVKAVFDEYAGEAEDYRFTRTHIPLRLALYEGEQMVSRSQAKRILARAEKFTEIVLDFSGIKQIGQAFADEVFRVYASGHPNVHLNCIRTTPAVDHMIRLARDSGQLPLFAENANGASEPQLQSLLSPDGVQE